MREGNEGGQPGQAPEGGVPSVGPGRGGQTPDGGRRPTWMGWMVLREAGIDWTEVEQLTSDRKGVKGKGGGENGAFGQVGKAEGAWV